MEIFGWIVLITFALIGFAVVVILLVEFAWAHLRIFKAKVGKNIEVMKENVHEKGELKRVRLAKKRAANDKLAHRKLDVQIATKQDKSNEKYGTVEKQPKQKKEDKEEYRNEEN